MISVTVQKSLHLADCPYRVVGTGVVQFSTVKQLRRYAIRNRIKICGKCEKRMKSDAAEP